MTEQNAPSGEDTNVDSRRRKMLAALGAGGLAGVAGCSGGGGGDGNDTATETETQTQDSTSSGGNGTTQEGTTTQSGAQMTDRTYQLVFAGGPADGEQQPISDFSWLPYDARGSWPRFVYPYCITWKMTLDQGTGEILPMLVDEWETSSNEIHLHIREDAKYSDGSDITGKALGLPALVGRHTGGLSPDAIKEMGGPQSVGQAITNYAWDGKDVYFRTPEGTDWLDQFYLFPWLRNLTNAGATEFGARESYWQAKYDKLVEKYPDMAGANSGDTPTLWNKQTTGTATTKAAAAGQYWDALLGGDGTIKTNQQASLKNDPDLPNDPTELVLPGPFTLKQLREDGVTLERNEHHWNAENINWPEINLTLQPETRAQYALMKNDRLDGDPNMVPQEQVIESFPDHIKPHQWGGGGITALMASYQHEILGTPQVRWALLHALDKQQLVDVGNKYTNTLVSEAPGLHVRGEDQYMSDELQKKYQTYEFDRERAAQLLKAQGFSRESNQWYKPNGDRWKMELITDSNQINTEATLVSQLNDFGISVSLRKLTSTLYNQRIENANYDIAVAGWGGGSPSGPSILGIYYRALTQGTRARKWGLWDWDEVVKWGKETEGIDYEQASWTDYLSGLDDDYEKTKRWTVKAPPVGEPDSNEMKEYPIAYWGYLWNHNISQEKRNEIIQGVTWVFNWRLAPFMPFKQTTGLAFQDHKDWDATEKPEDWQQYLPQTRMFQQGPLIQAKPK